MTFRGRDIVAEVRFGYSVTRLALHAISDTSRTKVSDLGVDLRMSLGTVL